jgi:peptidoglycan hydrolase-like protein with peptidoglycan-binding domain
VLAGVTLLSTGGATGFLLRPATAPRELRAATEVTTAPVGREDLTDERTVKISLHRSTAPPLVVGLAGRVTANSCRPGRVLISGRAVARINNIPLIALATPTPLYRSLARGQRGDDVTALQRELRRLRYPVRITGSYDSRTTVAVRRLQQAAGVERPDGRVDVGRILWLPGPAVVADSCELIQGGYASVGQTYAKARAQLTAVVVESIPPNTVAGDRVIEAMGVTGPLGRDGTATDPAFLKRVADTREYRMVEAADEDPELTAGIALKSPLRTLKVPPGALFAVEGDRGCIQSGPTAYPVTIVGSRLGATLVSTPQAPTQVNLGSAITMRSCG